MTKQLTFNQRLSAAFILVLLSVTSANGDNDDSIPLKGVPQAVIKTAIEAVEGIELLKAELEKEDGVTVYEIKGTTKDFDYEMEISKDGKLLELEQERKED